MKRMLFPATVLVTVGLLLACGGSMSPTQVAKGIPMSLTIGDTPPPGVAVLPTLRSRSAGKRWLRTEASACWLQFFDFGGPPGGAGCADSSGQGELL